MRLYRGDVVIIALGPEIVRGAIRAMNGERAMVQIRDDWKWVPVGELRWDGECDGFVRGRAPDSDSQGVRRAACRWRGVTP